MKMARKVVERVTLKLRLRARNTTTMSMTARYKTRRGRR
jgi:hypothetical protein